MILIFFAPFKKNLIPFHTFIRNVVSVRIYNEKMDTCPHTHFDTDASGISEVDHNNNPSCSDVDSN